VTKSENGSFNSFEEFKEMKNNLSFMKPTNTKPALLHVV
jgi:hypothetical protein